MSEPEFGNQVESTAPFGFSGSYGLKEIVGVAFIAIALYLAHWVFQALSQMWNHPETVGLLSFMLDFIKQTEAPDSSLPFPFEDFIALSSVFLTVCVLSSVVSLIKIFLVNGSNLLFNKPKD